MLCAACGAAADAATCEACGANPRLDGRYQLDRVLGQGAQGTTFSATGPDGEVAVKELPVGRGADPGQLARLQREAAILGQLTHPAIPRLRETFFAGEGRARCLYVVQDRVEGADLERWIEGHRTSEPEVVAILLELCGVLGWLHGRSPPVLHRDLKPANVIRAPDGALRLVDFGSVRDALRDPDLGGSTVAGTFGYMAPEQMVGDASPRSDLYSLGALAVRLLTRQQPASLLDRSGQMRWRDHARVGPGLAALLDDLLAPELAARPPSAAAVSDRLDAIQRGEDLSQTPIIEPEVIRGELASAGPLPVLDRRPDADAQAVADLLQRGLERDGQLVPTATGWQWMDLGGRVTVDLEPDGDRVTARPRFSAAPWALAVTLAALFVALAGGASIWALAAGALVAKKAITLLIMSIVMAVGGAAGPVLGDLGRRRRVQASLAAAGARIQAPRGPRAPGGVVPGPLTEPRAQQIAATVERELGLAGELRPMGGGWRWRSNEDGRTIDVFLREEGGHTRVTAEESLKAMRGNVWGGFGGAFGGLGFTGAVLASALLSPAAGVAVGVASVLAYIALCVGIMRRVGGRRQADIARAVDAAVGEAGGGPRRALPAPPSPDRDSE